MAVAYFIKSLYIERAAYLFNLWSAEHSKELLSIQVFIWSVNKVSYKDL